METENSVDKEKSNKNVSVCSVQKAEKHPGKQGQFMIGVKKVAE